MNSRDFASLIIESDLPEVIPFSENRVSMQVEPEDLEIDFLDRAKDKVHSPTNPNSRQNLATVLSAIEIEDLAPPQEYELSQWLEVDDAFSHLPTEDKASESSERESFDSPTPKHPEQTQPIHAAHPTQTRKETQAPIAKLFPIESSSALAQGALSKLIPSFLSLAEAISNELFTNLRTLLNLNPSRREHLVQYLCYLSHSPSKSLSPRESSEILREWITQPKATSRSDALHLYIEEIALIYLSQVLLLKVWNDNQIRSWGRTDLGHLNWSLGKELKSHLPVMRENWYITRPNLYSWFTPSETLQDRIWETLNRCSLKGESGALFVDLIKFARKREPNLPESRGYDPRFFISLWENLPKLGFDPSGRHHEGLIEREKAVFCPTLRDGSIVRSSPRTIQWVGLEKSPFQLILSELSELWSGPKAPPLWTIGDGLNVYGKEQISMCLSGSIHSTQNRIAEMEACDLSIVMEERSVLLSGKSMDSQHFKELAHSMPSLKKLRSEGTTLGDLQTCVSIGKLRPNCLLVWFRERPLGKHEGTEFLKHVLEKGQLLCEFDFSGVEHALPTAKPLFPKYIYIIKRTLELEERNKHHPTQVSIRGQIRSHVEVPVILEDAFLGFSSKNDPQQPRGQWQIHTRKNPNPQSSWIEHWPDPTQESMIRDLETLRTRSTPLGQIAMVRSVSAPEKSKPFPLNFHGVWLQSFSEGKKPGIRAIPTQGSTFETSKKGFLIALPDRTWSVVIANYLESLPIRNWLEHYAEKKRGGWVLSEQTIKYLPIAENILSTLKNPSIVEASLVDPNHRKWLQEIPFNPAGVIQALTHPQTKVPPPMRGILFKETCLALDQFRQTQAELFALITPNEKIDWMKFIKVLPKKDSVPFSIHPDIRLSGSLPSNLPIHQMEKIQKPFSGVSLRTEAGLQIQVFSENNRLITMIWDFIKNLNYPTWGELTHSISVPLDIESAYTTGMEVLESYREQKLKQNKLIELLSVCLNTEQ